MRAFALRRANTQNVARVTRRKRPLRVQYVIAAGRRMRMTRRRLASFIAAENSIYLYKDIFIPRSIDMRNYAIPFFKSPIQMRGAYKSSREI